MEGFNRGNCTCLKSKSCGQFQLVDWLKHVPGNGLWSIRSFRRFVLIMYIFRDFFSTCRILNPSHRNYWAFGPCIGDWSWFKGHLSKDQEGLLWFISQAEANALWQMREGKLHEGRHYPLLSMTRDWAEGVCPLCIFSSSGKQGTFCSEKALKIGVVISVRLLSVAEVLRPPWEEMMHSDWLRATTRDICSHCCQVTRQPRQKNRTRFYWIGALKETKGKACVWPHFILSSVFSNRVSVTVVFLHCQWIWWIILFGSHRMIPLTVWMKYGPVWFSPSCSKSTVGHFMLDLCSVQAVICHIAQRNLQPWWKNTKNKTWLTAR